MSRHDLQVRLQHMLDAAREAGTLVAGRSRADYDEDRTLRLALIRLLEVFGEAASRIPLDSCEEHPEIPWFGVVGLRNRLIHGYDDVDYDIVWRILAEDIRRSWPRWKKPSPNSESDRHFVFAWAGFLGLATVAAAPRSRGSSVQVAVVGPGLLHSGLSLLHSEIARPQI
jgi:uncharacterized protein with HEPN domain